MEDEAKLTNVFIKAKKIAIKSRAVLSDCKLFSDGIVTIGENSTIKERTIINAFRGITIGEQTIIDRDVMIGGMQSEKSEIIIGNDCAILYRSYLNTTRRILIGNNVGIGGYCLIFTHSAWQNALEGNPVKFADVKIKDNVWLPWNVTVMPGIVIQRDVTIGSGSVITKSLPSNVFAAGIPAKIIQKKEKQGLSKEDKAAVVFEIMSDFRRYLSKFLKIRNSKRENLRGYAIYNKNQRLVFSLDFKKLKKSDVVISFRIPKTIKDKFEWIELDSLRSQTKDNTLANHFILFVRRYGIKVRPV